MNPHLFNELQRQLLIAMQEGDIALINQINAQILAMNQMSEFSNAKGDLFQADMYNTVLSGGFIPDIY